MTISVYARRYARTIFKIALDKKELNRWQSDLRKIDSLLDDKALCALLENPQIRWDEKAKVLSARIGEVNPLIIKLVALLVVKGKLPMIREINEEYQRQVDEYRGIEGVETAEVITAVSLDSEYQIILAQRITDIMGKPVILKTQVDPSIIGGIIIKVGDKLIDGSLRSKLAALRKELGGVAKYQGINKK
jgi:F-type H+-transporting ATPase subunit delta